MPRRSKSQKLQSLLNLAKGRQKSSVNAHLDLQLDWYRTFVDPLTGSTAVKVPKKNAVGLKALKITALKDAIARYELLPEEIREDVEERAGGEETDDNIALSEHQVNGGESDDDV